jgi:hypothetical protein
VDLSKRGHRYEVRDGGSYVKSEITLFKQHKLYDAGMGLLLVPPFYYVVARGPLDMCYLLLDEFNTVVKAEGPAVDSVEEAWELAKIYIYANAAGFPFKIINNTTEIPGLSPQYIEKLNKSNDVESRRWAQKRYAQYQRLKKRHYAGGGASCGRRLPPPLLHLVRNRRRRDKVDNESGKRRHNNRNTERRSSGEGGKLPLVAITVVQKERAAEKVGTT